MIPSSRVDTKVVRRCPQLQHEAMSVVHLSAYEASAEAHHRPGREAAANVYD